MELFFHHCKENKIYLGGVRIASNIAKEGSAGLGLEFSNRKKLLMKLRWKLEKVKPSSTNPTIYAHCNRYDGESSDLDHATLLACNYNLLISISFLYWPRARTFRIFLFKLLNSCFILFFIFSISRVIRIRLLTYRVVAV